MAMGNNSAAGEGLVGHVAGRNRSAEPLRDLVAERPAPVSVYRELRFANSVNIMS